MQWLKKLIGLVTLSWLPPARRRRTFYWIFHLLIVALILVGLGWLNLRGGLDRVLNTRLLHLNLFWLPLLFLLGYTLFWLIRWMYWLLGPDGPAGEFDDIERAWSKARAALEAASLSLQELPVFLVLGKTGGLLEDAFAASRIPFQIRHVPPGDDEPLHLYANREAIFLSCERAALLPIQVARLLQAERTGQPQPSPSNELLQEYLDRTAASATTSSLVEPPKLPWSQAQPGAVLLLGQPEPRDGLPPTARRESLLTDHQEVELQTKRLRHICNLLVRDRKPYCPVNGILVLLPLAATTTAEDASETAQVVRHDLEVAREALQMDCARLFVLGDAEQLPGFVEVVRHFPQDGSGPNWVLGQHFPLVPDLSAAEIQSRIETGLAWVGDAMLPLVVGHLWRREGEVSDTDRQTSVEANIQLYEFLHACRQRLARFGKLAARAVQSDEGVPPYLAGCYLAGTGPDAEREQGFLTGVFRRALEQQNYVRWTADALADDAAYHWYSLVGYALLALFVLVITLTLIAWW